MQLIDHQWREHADILLVEREDRRAGAHACRGIRRITGIMARHPLPIGRRVHQIPACDAAGVA